VSCKVCESIHCERIDYHFTHGARPGQLSCMFQDFSREDLEEHFRHLKRSIADSRAEVIAEAVRASDAAWNLYERAMTAPKPNPAVALRALRLVLTGAQVRGALLPPAKGDAGGGPSLSVALKAELAGNPEFLRNALSMMASGAIGELLGSTVPVTVVSEPKTAEKPPVLEAICRDESAEKGEDE
jgi:hypothetical protein